MENNQNPPVADPVVDIDGTKWVCVFNKRAEFKCSEWGINPAEAMSWGSGNNPRAYYYIVSLWAACVASNFVGVRAMTPEEWADKLGDRTDLFMPISTAIVAALKKRWPTPTQQGETTSAATPDPSASVVN